MVKYSDKTRNFFNDVYEVVKLIPNGRVTSYGAIARYLGSGKSARIVGWAMNAAHTIPDVPAHRVVNSQGLLTGKAHFSTPFEMEEKLFSEGVKVKNNQIVAFDTVLWDPSLELDINL